jgi:hypothetical protein
MFFKEKNKEENTIRDYKIIGNGSTGIDITSSILVTDLVNMGIGYRKTNIDWELPNINSLLMRHFIRGFFDGDGSITGHASIDKGRKNYRFKQAITIDAKREKVINNLLLFFDNNGIRLNKNYLKRDDMWRCTTTSREKFENVFHLLYDNSYFYLTRKFNKFNYYVNTEVSQLISDYCNA